MKYNVTSLLLFALFAIFSFAGIIPAAAADKLKTDSLFKSEINIICKPFRIPDSSIQAICLSHPPEPDCRDTMLSMKKKDIRYCYKIREGLFIVRNMNGLPALITLYTSGSDNDSINLKLRSVGFENGNDDRHRKKLAHKSLSIESDIVESPRVPPCIRGAFNGEIIEWKIYMPLQTQNKNKKP